MNDRIFATIVWLNKEQAPSLISWPANTPLGAIRTQLDWLFLDLPIQTVLKGDYT